MLFRADNHLLVGLVGAFLEHIVIRSLVRFAGQAYLLYNNDQPTLIDCSMRYFNHEIFELHIDRRRCRKRSWLNWYELR